MRLLPYLLVFVLLTSVAFAVCGDGVLNNGEECDGNAGLVSCVALGYNGGSATCDSNCHINVRGCTSATSVSAVLKSDSLIVSSTPGLVPMYRLFTTRPATCTLTNVLKWNPTSGWVALNPADFTDQSVVGSLRHFFWMKSGNGTYAFNKTCTSTCGTPGHYTCEGDETAGYPVGTGPGGTTTIYSNPNPPQPYYGPTCGGTGPTGYSVLYCPPDNPDCGSTGSNGGGGTYQNPSTCGNNICDNGETSASCPSDCPLCATSGSVCNSGYCSCPSGYTYTGTSCVSYDPSKNCPSGTTWDSSVQKCGQVVVNVPSASVCPSDCGCGPGLSYGKNTSSSDPRFICGVTCNTQTTSFAGQTWTTQGCSAAKPTIGSLVSGKVCQLSGTTANVCVSCPTGTYLDNTGQCRYAQGDDICATYAGEPSTSSDCQCKTQTLRYGSTDYVTQGCSAAIGSNAYPNTALGCSSGKTCAVCPAGTSLTSSGNCVVIQGDGICSTQYNEPLTSPDCRSYTCPTTGTTGPTFDSCTTSRTCIRNGKQVGDQCVYPGCWASSECELL